MKSARLAKLAAVVSACAFALVIAVGCSSGSSSASSSASGSASSTASSAASSSASASSDAQSSTAASSVASSTAASSAASQSASASSAASGLTEDEALAQGYQVFKGTMRVVSADELVNLQGADSQLAAGQDGTYAVVVFDSPTDVTGQLGDGSGETTRSANLIGVAESNKYGGFGDLDACKALDGQQVAVAAKAEAVRFPSDVRLPINEPNAKEIVVIS